ncbi:hypothetical protein IV203_010201 [Nitzschia inconspicua]|uniref:Uncharacterized protein n=1 Tax=Nitzschia inconspicua TaxID=303405 RepID=A0A9K3KWH3_9STRA|nr:hypothetical protein IV203_010201 [Nitzschia inconspicua]
MITTGVAAPAAGNVTADDDDVLSSIRAVRELLDQEFGGGHQASTNTTPATPTTQNHWKTKFYQLKQSHYDEKLQFEAKLDQQHHQLRHLEHKLKLAQQEADSEREMRKTLEATLDSHQKHIQILTKQLDKAQSERAQLEVKLKDFTDAVETGRDSLQKERSTWEELVKQIRIEKDHLSQKLGEEEAGRIRAQAWANELQKTVKLQHIRWQEAQSNMEKLQKQHALEVAMAKKVLQQKVNVLQDQVKKLAQSASAAARSASLVSDANVKLLQSKVKQLEETNTTMKNELDLKTKVVTEQTSEQDTLKQQYNECQASNIKLSKDLETVKAELATLKSLDRAHQSQTTTIPQTAAQVKRANLIQRFETVFTQDLSAIESLQSQITVMEKAQPSKKVKEGLAEKKKALHEKKASQINTLEKIEKLQDQQVQAIQKQLDEAAVKLEAARKEWYESEERLSTTTNVPNQNEEMQAKVDASASAFSIARQQVQSIKMELSNLLSQRSENRGRLANLRDVDDGTSGSSPTKATTDNAASAAAGSKVAQSSTATQKRASQEAKQRSKRRKTSTDDP